MLEFLSYLEKERGFSNHTIKAYQTDLNRFILFLTQEENISNFKSVNIHTIRNYLGAEFDEGFSSKTVARRLASIKSLFKYLMRSEQISDNPAIHVKSPTISQTLPNFIDEDRKSVV